MKKINLSFKKLLGLLEKHSYITKNVYSSENLIKIVECKSPKFQKSFFIFIPDKYSLKNIKLPKSVKNYNILLSKDVPSSYHIEFMSNMKGELLECDLSLVTGNDIFLYFDNGEYKYYILTDAKIKPVLKKKDKIDKLLSKSAKIIKKLDYEESSKKLTQEDTNAKKEDLLDVDENDILDENDLLDENDILDVDENDLPWEEEDEILEKEEKTSIKKDKEIIDKNDAQEKEKLSDEEGEVEIVFENEKGELIDDVKIFLEKEGKVPIDDLENIKDKLKLHESSLEDLEYENEGVASLENSIPSNIKEIEITLGFVAVCIDIHKFFKKMENYEVELIEYYHGLSENELENRTKKLEDIKELTDTLIEKAQHRINEKNKKEQKIKKELFKLISVYTQIADTRKKIESNPMKYQSDILKLDDVYNQTRNAIHSTNIKLLKNRDEIYELLNNYTITLQECIKL